jgi:hypothetical protein
MSTVNCRNCNALNPAGSKFCNNCGTPLPPGTKLICPSCKTPNPRDLLYCDNCGTRLVQQEAPPPKPKPRPADQENEGEEPTSPAHRAFSLPTRQQGNTVDLDIRSLPDWLRADWAGEEPAAAEKESAPPAPASEEAILGSWLSELEEVESEPPAATDKPDWRQPGGASLSSDDEMPDWLMEMEQSAAPAEPVTSADFPDWLAETAAEQPASLPSAADEGLPDWLMEARGERTTAVADDIDFPDWLSAADDEPATPEATVSADDEFPDWLSAAAGEPTTSEASLPADDDFSGWLSAVADEPTTPETALPAGDNFLDWLSTAADEPATPEASLPADDDFSGWLSTATDEPTTPEASLPADDEFPDWLSIAAGESTSPEAALPAGDELPDWLSAASSEEAAVEAGVTAGDDFPDWFQASAEEPAAGDLYSPADDEGADWLSVVTGGPAAGTSGEEAADDFGNWLQGAESETAGDDDIFGEDLPDWLKDSPLSPADSRLKGGTDELSQWLVDAIETTPTTAAPAQPAQPVAAEANLDDDMPDWLRDVQSLGTAAEAAIFSETATPPSQSSEPEAPDWLNAQVGLDEETAASIFELADEEDSGAFPDWFSAAEPEAPAQAAALPFQPEQSSPSDDLPDWIKEMAPRNTGLLGGTGNLLVGDEEAAEDNFDWLSDVTPEVERRGGTGPLPEVGLPDALPDWLADLAPPDTGSLGRPRTGGLERPRTGPLPPKSPDKSDLEQPDWLSDLLPDSSDEEEPPVTPTRRRLPDVPVTELPSARQRRTGPLTPPTPPSQELEGVPSELAAADLPEWLTTELGPPPGPGGPSIPLIREVPDWLDAPEGDAESLSGAVLGSPPEGLTGAEWQDILSGLPPGSSEAAGGAIALAEGDIPPWLQALRPRAFGEGGPVPLAADEPALTTGPLAGIRGAIDIEATAAQPHQAKRLPTATISKDQQRQMTLLRQLMHDDQRQAIPVDRRPAAAASTVTRLILTVILLLAVGAGLYLSDALPAAAPPPAESVADVQQMVSEAREEPVLVVFDYSPATAGELDPQARMLVRQLQENGSTIFPVTQFVTGMGIAQQIDPSRQPTFIAGEGIGLRSLADCLQAGTTCLTGEALPADIGLIVLLTSEQDSLTNWVEQVRSSTNVPMVAAVTQSVAPVALTYDSAEQLDGVIAGLPAAAAYEGANRPGETAVAEQLAGQTLAQWVVIILLIVGSVGGWLLSLRPRPAKGGGS